MAKNIIETFPCHMYLGCVRDHFPGVGVTKPISSVRYFLKFSALSEHTLAFEYHVYI